MLNDVEDVLGRWKGCCEELYNYQTDKDDTILDILKSAAVPNETAPPIIKAEVKEAVRSLKDNKSPGVDNIQGELLNYGGEEVIEILQDICNKILKTGIWPEDWTTLILIPIPKRASFKCADHGTIALISHASKVMLKILQKRIAPTVESLLGDFQAGFRAGGGTAEQVTNFRILCEKYIERDSKVFLNFVDYRKAFDRVWHDAIWAVLRKYGIDENIMRALEQLYTKSTSKVRVGAKFSEKFSCSVEVRQGCVLSPSLFNVFLEEIVNRSVEESTGGVCV